MLRVRVSFYASHADDLYPQQRFSTVLNEIRPAVLPRHSNEMLARTAHLIRARETFTF